MATRRNLHSGNTRDRVGKEGDRTCLDCKCQLEPPLKLLLRLTSEEGGRKFSGVKVVTQGDGLVGELPEAANYQLDCQWLSVEG